MKTTHVAMALALTIGCAMASPSAHCASQIKRMIVNASGVCQSALPVFDVQIRKRPKAVQNEGDKSAFVTCTYYGHDSQIFGSADDRPTTIDVYASVQNGRPGSVTCTGVLGYQGNTYPIAPKTIALDSSGGINNMFWTAADFGGTAGDPLPSGLFSVSCNLDPGVGLNNSAVIYSYDVGA